MELCRIYPNDSHHAFDRCEDKVEEPQSDHPVHDCPQARPGAGRADRARGKAGEPGAPAQSLALFPTPGSCHLCSCVRNKAARGSGKWASFSGTGSSRGFSAGMQPVTHVSHSPGPVAEAETRDDECQLLSVTGRNTVTLH